MCMRGEVDYSGRLSIRESGNWAFGRVLQPELGELSKIQSNFLSED